MRSEPRKRTITNGVQVPLVGLDSGFADLALPVNLPVGTDEATLSTGTVNPPLWKLGRVVLRREKAHRGGKTVIVIDDFATHLPLSVIEQTAKKVRAACGCGGTVKRRQIEIQGDIVAKVRTVLEVEGFQVAGVK